MSDSPRHRRKRIACRQCRQAKIRCELSTGGNTPCSRCRRMGIDCRVDTAFQRVNRRERLDDLEKEIQHLRSSVSTLPTASARPLRRISPDPIPDASLDAEPSFVQTRPPDAKERLLLTGSPTVPTVPLLERYSPPIIAQAQPSPLSNLTNDDRTSTSPRSLDFLDFGGKQIDNHFNVFFQKYHPHAPILDPAVSPDAYFSRSPLLFWVVILVSSRRYSDEPGLFVSLAAPVKKILWDTIANPPHSWHLVQSIVLLCLWPFPTSSLSTDNTSVLVSMAQSIATRLGLHRPEAIQDFSRTRRRLTPEEVSEAARTWAACYIVAQNVATVDGQVWVSPDWMIDRLCDRDGGIIPASLRHQLLISRFSGRVCRLMSDNVHSLTGAPRPGESIFLLGIFETEFQDMSCTLSDQLTDENKILLHGAGLQLYVYYLLDNGQSDLRKKGLVRAYNLATELITTFTTPASAYELPEHGPVSYFRVLCLAAMFILRLCYSNMNGSLDIDSGKSAFSSAICLTRRISLDDNDLPGRMSRILTQLWSAQMRSGSRDKDPSLKLKTRMAASLIHDSLWMWREEFGGQRNTAQTPPVGMRNPGLAVQNLNVGSTQDEAAVEGWTLEDMIDAEMLALLPFNLDGEP